MDPYWLGVLHTLAALGGTVLFGGAFMFGAMWVASRA